MFLGGKRMYFVVFPVSLVVYILFSNDDFISDIMQTYITHTHTKDYIQVYTHVYSISCIMHP